MSTAIGRMEVLGVSFYVGEPTDAARQVVARAKERSGGYVCLCNAHVLVTAKHDSELADALNEAWLTLPDGAPVAWLQRRLGPPAARRVGGPDLMPAVIDLGRVDSLRHFLFGSKPDVLERLSERLSKAYPGVDIVG